MAKLTIDLGPMIREAMIEGLADFLDAFPNYRYAVILELLRRDDTSRVMLTEALGEEGLRVTRAEAEEQAAYDRGDRATMPDEETWDDISRRIIAQLQDTPGGRAEVSS